MTDESFDRRSNIRLKLLSEKGLAQIDEHSYPERLGDWEVRRVSWPCHLSLPSSWRSISCKRMIPRSSRMENWQKFGDDRSHFHSFSRGNRFSVCHQQRMHKQLEIGLNEELKSSFASLNEPSHPVRLLSDPWWRNHSYTNWQRCFPVVALWKNLFQWRRVLNIHRVSHGVSTASLPPPTSNPTWNN